MMFITIICQTSRNVMSNGAWLLVPYLAWVTFRLYYKTRIKISISFIIVIAAFGESESLGCPVPVFRYALERWPADYYTAEIEYCHELSGESESVAKLLEKCSEGDGETLCNLYVKLKQVEGVGRQGQH